MPLGDHGTDTTNRTGLIHGLAILPPEAFRAIAGHVYNRNIIAIGHWVQELDPATRCGCLMMNGYMKDHPDAEPEGAYTSPHIAELLGDYYGCGDRLTKHAVHMVARNFDGWARNGWNKQYAKKFIDPDDDAECYEELARIIATAAKERGGS